MADTDKPARKKAPAAKKATKRPPPKAGTSKLNRLRLTHSGLTPEQEAYCRGRAMGMSIEEAVSAAGNSVSVHTARGWEGPTGHNRNPLVVDRINELASLAAQNAILKSGLDREWVISRYMKVVERCMQAEPVYDKQGNPTGEYRFDSTGANNALRALGDTLGLFKPVEKKPEDDYAHLSDDDLARITAELAAQLGFAQADAGAPTTGECQQAGELQAIPQADRLS